MFEAISCTIVAEAFIFEKELSDTKRIASISLLVPHMYLNNSTIIMSFLCT